MNVFPGRRRGGPEPEIKEEFRETKKKGPKPCPKCGKPGYYFHLKKCLNGS